MRNYINVLDKYKWLVAFLVPFFVFALASNLKHIQIDGSYRIWFGEDSKILKDYDKFRSTFGNDDSVIISFKDEDGIFTKKALQSIDNITNALWKTKYIARVDSITNYQYVYGEEEDVVVEDFISDIQNATPSYLNERKNIAINDPLVEGGFISKDGTTTMIVARLIPKVNDESAKNIAIMGYVNKIIEKEIEATGYKFWLNGGPVLNHSFIEIGTGDATTFTPLVLIVSAFLLMVLFRRVSGALIPLGVVVFTFLSVLAVQVLLGFKLNNFTANLPVFVVAIGIADAVHMYIIWIMYKREGKENKEAVYLSVQKNFLPIFLTSTTTAIGFATLTISKVVPVFTLGIATACGAILAFIISVFWLPAVLLILKKPVKQSVVKEIKEKKPLGYGKFIVQNNKKIVLFSTLIFLVLGVGLFKVKVDSNTIRYFDESVEIRKSTEFIMKNLTGPMSYEIVVDSKSKNGIKEPKFLKTVERFYSDFSSKYSDVRHIHSLLDIIKRFNKILDKSETVPKTKELVAQYLLLYSFSLPQGMEISDKMDIDEQKLRITARMNMTDTSKDLEMINYVSEWWAKTEYSAQVNGITSMFAYMQSDVTDTLVYSLSLAIILVSLILFLIFRRLRILWVFVLPNLLPVVLVVGFMGWLGITIDIGVAIAGAIIIGVAVDDTIHFLVKYFDARKRGLSFEDTFDEVLKYAGRAIAFTTIILSISFALFSFSHFSPNTNFGIVTATALILAFVVDLLFLPALLSLSDKEPTNTKKS